MYPPMPYWGYMPPPYPCPIPKSGSVTDETDSENPSPNASGYWNHPCYQPGETEDEAGENRGYPPYPYFDPYYYYYYGYPPVYLPYPYYGGNDTEDCSGYSSTDEIAYYNRNSANVSNSSIAGNMKPALTPTLKVKEEIIGTHLATECITEEPQKEMELGLKSIKSVPNINVFYEEEEEESQYEASSDENSNATDEDSEEEEESAVGEDGYPHQLSVIFEESERADSRLRSASAMSDATTIGNKSDDEEEVVPKSYQHSLKAARDIMENIEENVDTGDDIDTEISASFTIKSPSKQASPCRREEGEDTEEEEEEERIENSHSCQTDDEEEMVENHAVIKDKDKVDQPDVKAVEEVDEGKESDESEDWWGIIGREDDLPKPRAPSVRIENLEEKIEVLNEEDDESAEPNLSEDEIRTNEELDGEEDTVTKISEAVNEEIKEEKSNVLSAEYNKRSIYDDSDEDDNAGKLIEMDSFVAQLEEIKKQAGLWKADLKLMSNKQTSERSTTLRKETVKDKEVKTANLQKYSQSAEETRACKDDLMLMCKNHTTESLSAVKKKYVEDTKEGRALIQESSQTTEEIDVCSSDFRSTTKKQADEFPKISKKESIKEAIVQTASVQVGSQATEEVGVLTSTEKLDYVNKVKVTSCLKEESFVSNYSASYTDYSCSSSKSETEAPSTKESHIKEPITKYKHRKVMRQEEVIKADSEESTDGTTSSSEDENDKRNDENNNENEVKVMSIKERIQSLRECIKQKQAKYQEQETKINVKEKISALEIGSTNRSKTTSTKSSLKSFEEYSEEEDFDSGVTSDMSRHISDNEEFPELRKLTKYQRAATHSRLFKLLQEECCSDDEEGTTDKDIPRRDRLTLPLNKSPDRYSACSSGVSSPKGSVNEKLVEELVQSLLKRKKGQIFRNIPKEKLYSAAARILQEDFQELDINEDCSSFLSPLRCSTGYSTAAETPQEFNSSFDEYSQYYDSWKDVDDYDILPSKAFRELRSTGSIASLLKCPRVLSSKNIHKKLLRLLEKSESTARLLEKPIDTNEVTTAS